ncbi:MAG: hypothetical protein BMS9Abin21_235 [Thermodesulfovibrionia bacterium]|nr:MAG: hypothetical protein BMS9Abin21_235 [Thermodesulfovibrionia bacterium]
MIKLAENIPLYPTEGFTSPGTLGENPGANPGYGLAQVISIIIGVLTVVAAIWFLIKLISGGIAIISSGGDKGKLANARGDITYGLVGILIVVTATIFVSFVLELLGIENILNISDTLDALAP